MLRTALSPLPSAGLLDQDKLLLPRRDSFFWQWYRISSVSWPILVLATAGNQPCPGWNQDIAPYSIPCAHVQFIHLPTRYIHLYLYLCVNIYISTSTDIISVVSGHSSKMSVEFIQSVPVGPIIPRCLPGQEGCCAVGWFRTSGAHMACVKSTFPLSIQPRTGSQGSKRSYSSVCQSLWKQLEPLNRLPGSLFQFGCNRIWILSVPDSRTPEIMLKSPQVVFTRQARKDHSPRLLSVFFTSCPVLTGPGLLLEQPLV